MKNGNGQVPKPFIRKHQIVFVRPEEIDTVLHAKMGWGTQAIANLTGLSKGQVNYRARKGELLEYGKAKPGQPRITYRSGWRNGTSPEARMVSQLVRAKIRPQIARTLPLLVESIPTAQMPK